ncbi:MAG: hypothetical protein H7A37_05435 [Chlamydiales bacterium]|nr:hypothetical protein [Chlamydiia bacterium]MCP5507722.1 hypothetical protein [Chlamydiales bacterium]
MTATHFSSCTNYPAGGYQDVSTWINEGAIDEGKLNTLIQNSDQIVKILTEYSTDGSMGFRAVEMILRHMEISADQGTVTLESARKVYRVFQNVIGLNDQLALSMVEMGTPPVKISSLLLFAASPEQRWDKGQVNNPDCYLKLNEWLVEGTVRDIKKIMNDPKKKKLAVDLLLLAQNKQLTDFRDYLVSNISNGEHALKQWKDALLQSPACFDLNERGLFFFSNPKDEFFVSLHLLTEFENLAYNIKITLTDEINSSEVNRLFLHLLPHAKHLNIDGTITCGIEMIQEIGKHCRSLESITFSPKILSLDAGDLKKFMEYFNVFKQLCRQNEGLKPADIHVSGDFKILRNSLLESLSQQSIFIQDAEVSHH